MADIKTVNSNFISDIIRSLIKEGYSIDAKESEVDLLSQRMKAVLILKDDPGMKVIINETNTDDLHTISVNIYADDQLVTSRSYYDYVSVKSDKDNVSDKYNSVNDIIKIKKSQKRTDITDEDIATIRDTLSKCDINKKHVASSKNDTDKQNEFDDKLMDSRKQDKTLKDKYYRDFYFNGDKYRLDLSDLVETINKLFK